MKLYLIAVSYHVEVEANDEREAFEKALEKDPNPVAFGDLISVKNIGE